jgi:quercetin dioxygenase-like cupin family protein
MRQPLQYPWTDFDVDGTAVPAISVRVDVIETGAEVTEHQHRKGQLVFALAGGVTCRVPSGLWMVPAHCAVWIPGGVKHSNIATANAKLFFVYIEPGAADLPDRCCTISISPLLRELIVELSERPHTNDSGEL